jgi:REP element-mobilizing transposase RayT
MLFCMPNYRRDWTPGGTWFFTVNLLQRRGNDLLKAKSDCLRDCIALERRRYWEHAIRDDVDLRRHIDYIHFNPVKHGHVDAVRVWPFSSFHHYVRRGELTANWAVP